MNDVGGFDGAAFARMDEVVARAVEQGQAPGVVAAVARGGTVHVATAGAAFDDVMRDRLLAPLGMSDTGFNTEESARLATAYENRDGRLEVSDPPDGQWSAAPRFPDGGWRTGVHR